jgi:hypothetical protein
MILKILKELEEQISSMQEKIKELELNLNYSSQDLVIIEKINLGEIEVINEDRGYIIFKYRECSFVENVNSNLHKGLIEGNQELIILKKIDKPQKWNYNYIVTHSALNQTQAAIIKNYNS